ncbi:MAG TPA: TolC family protein [Candidatus Acidoferrales bacterium]|nr:TolC family protein [Candidatus Acidoferrales bacterium]
MRRVFDVLAVLILLSAPAACPAAESDELGDPVKLAAVVAYGRAHNAEIHAAEAKWRAAQARPSQAGALPDPMVEVGYHNEGFDRLDLGETDFAWLRFGASQELPFPGKLALKRDIAGHAAEQTAEELRQVELDVISRLKMAYAEYAHLDVQLDILRRNKSLLDKFARTAEAKYAVGEGIQQDVLKAQVEESLLIERETTLDQQRQSRTAELNALLSRPATAPLGSAEHPVERALTRTLEELLAVAAAHSPEVKAAERRIAGDESAVALARREYLPDFVVRADYMHKADLLPEWEVGVGIKVPLYFATKQRAGVQEAAAALAEARSLRENADRNVQSRVRDLYARAQASERLITLYHSTVIPQARLALESADAAYQVNKVDFLTLLNAFAATLEYDMRYHEELANFQKAAAELESAVGEPLEE